MPGTLHLIFISNYVLLLLVFGIIMSDTCGIPDWYEHRVRQTWKPVGIQFISEHLVRCRYSDSWHALPWLAVYLFNVVLVQHMYTWTRLLMLVALQATRMGLPASSYRGAQMVFAALLFVSLVGLIGVVEFDHEMSPHTVTADGVPITWADLSLSHYAGVGLLLFSCLIVHMMIVYTYSQYVYNAYDFQAMCGIPEVGLGEKQACWKRRVAYWSFEGLYAFTLVLFLFFCLWQPTWAVLTEYILLGMFLLISMYNLVISCRLESVYLL